LKPSKPYKRVDRVNKQILDILANILIKDFDFSNLGFISLTSVDVSPDFKSAKVYFSILEPKLSVDQIVIAINNKRKNIKMHMASKLLLKNIPDLLFYYDDAVDKQKKIESLLKKNGLSINKIDN
tara:strand:- start:235 stop:609 length:375 start_codon:yes stop_codon:yes gene_type:complete